MLSWLALLTWIGKLDPSGVAVLGLTLVAALGLLDYATGYELSFSLLYMIPVSLASWFGGRKTGVMVALAAAAVWLTADLLGGHPYSHPLIPWWNVLIRLSYFLLFCHLLVALRDALRQQKALARIDSLTGAINSRAFYEEVELECERLARFGHPFTVAYIDLDNFKSINDVHGHPVGDRVLKTVVATAETTLRAVDVVARLGGDEFALLLPETSGSDARNVLEPVRQRLLAAMQASRWPVTFSMGAISCHGGTVNINQLMRSADALMYAVKHSGKNAIRFADLAGD